MSCLKQSTQADPGLPGTDRTCNASEAMQPRFPEQTPAEARNGRRVNEAAVPPQGVYLPNNNVLTPQMRSPEYVQMSNAAAITLGIMPGKMHRCGCTRCLNLLLTYPEGCRANCAYCGLARHREAESDYADRNFIRVDWPAVPMQQVVDIVARDGARSPFHRMCISMITHPDSDADAVAVLKAWTAKVDHFPQQIWDRPIVCRLAKEFDLVFSITKAEVTAREEGLVVLGLSGPESEYKKGIRVLKEQGVRVEPLARDVRRDDAKCTSCGACLAVCPTEALAVDRESWLVSFDPQKCIGCELCIPACPPRAMQTDL